MTATPSRFFVVHDRALVTTGLIAVVKQTPGVVLVGSARSGDEALDAMAAKSIDVVVVGEALKGRVSAVELCLQLTRGPDAVRVLVVGEGPGQPIFRALVMAGIKGYVDSGIDPVTLQAVFASLAAGHSWFDDAATNAMANFVSRRGSVTLSLQEAAVLGLIAAGHTNPEIARELGISLGSVKNYVSAAMHKLNATHRAQAIAVAAELGLLPSPRRGPGS